MALTKLTQDLNIIQTLATLPNDEGGLTDAQLKAKFDEGVNIAQDYINDTLIPELETLDSANVKTTGNQTISGVKTFNSSPIVPTPTADTQASNKKYVDDNFTSKNDIANDRKLSATGDFTGTLMGLPITSVSPGLDSAFVAHIANNSKHRLNILDFNCPTDGTTNILTALNSALAAASLVCGEVFIPPLENGYTLNVSTTTVTMPFGVSLKGESTGLFNGFNGVSLNKGTVIKVIGNAGNASGTPVFTITSGGTISNLSFVWPNQTPTNPPVAYPYLIAGLDSNCNDCEITNLFLYNCYQFLDLSVNHQRVKIKNIFGDVLKTGILLDHSWDVDKIEDIHFWCYYTQTKTTPEQTALNTYRMQNSTGIILGQADSIQGKNIFMWGLNRGIVLGIPETSGAPYGQFVNVSFDSCAVGIETSYLNPNGFYINNFMYCMGTALQASCGVSESYAIRLRHSIGFLQINNISVWGGPNKFLLSYDTFGGSGQARFNEIEIKQNIDGQLIDHRGTGELILSNIRCKLDKQICTAQTTRPIIENPDLYNESWFGSIAPIFKRYKVESTISVASADVLNIPRNARNIIVTGSTNINWITPVFPAGAEITLIFTASLAVGNAGTSYRLSSTFNATANDTLTLISDGTNWLEKSRSANI